MGFLNENLAVRNQVTIFLLMYSLLMTNSAHISERVNVFKYLHVNSPTCNIFLLIHSLLRGGSQ